MTTCFFHGEYDNAYEMGCPKCAECDWDACFHCGGSGGHHDCGEDSCCCADPDGDLIDCEECGGLGELPTKPAASTLPGGERPEEGGSSVRERPILFSGPMVRAILDGRKTQTRRVAPFHPLAVEAGLSRESRLWCSWERDPFATPDASLRLLDRDLRCPFGAPGDRLWVREAVRRIGDDCVEYVADGAVHPDANWPLKRPSLPSIFMPRALCRIRLEVEAVRVERLQEITNDDALNEGAMEWAAEQETPVRDATCSDARLVFHQGWDSLNAKRGYGWDTNPWVWVVTFNPLPLAPPPGREAT